MGATSIAIVMQAARQARSRRKEFACDPNPDERRASRLRQGALLALCDRLSKETVAVSAQLALDGIAQVRNLPEAFPRKPGPAG